MLGYNPIQNLLGPTGVLSRLPAANAATLTGKQFFPTLISGPFHHGLMIVFTAAALMSVVGAVVSMLRGKPAQLDDPPRGEQVAGRPPRRSWQASETKPFGKMYRRQSQTRIKVVPRYEYRCRACGDTFELTRPHERVRRALRLPARARRHRQAPVHRGRVRRRVPVGRRVNARGRAVAAAAAGAAAAADPSLAAAALIAGRPPQAAGAEITAR